MKRYIRSSTQEKVLTTEERIRLFGEEPKGEVVIPEGYTGIGEDAFKYCKSLKSVTISNGVTSIGNGAFYDCESLTSVTIPNSVTIIDEWAFVFCESLTDVIIPDSVTSIGEFAFYDCTSLTSITIPKGVTSIGHSAFGYCESLTSVTIGNSVTRIGDFAFAHCKSLTDVTFLGDMKSIELETLFYDTPVDEDMKQYYSTTDEDEQTLGTWEDVQNSLQSDFESGIDPIYRQTDAGSYIEGLCQDVESEMGVWLEPSIQAGNGGIWIYSSDDGRCIAEDIDYAGFNDTCIDLALRVNSEEEFKSAYRNYLKTQIE